MKSLTAILTLIICSTFLYSQNQVNHFSILKNEIIWQRIYDTQLSNEQLYFKMKESGVFMNLEKEENNNFIGELRPVTVDYLGAGYSYFQSPTYVYDKFTGGFAVIETQQGRYRVTLKKIYNVNKKIDSVFIMGKKEIFEDIVLKFEKKEFNQSFIRTGSFIYDYTFTQLFDFNVYSDENW